MRYHVRCWAAAAFVVAAAWLLEGQPGPAREDAYRQNNLGVAHLERYDYDAAAAAFREALKIDPRLAMARLNLAIALLYDGELDAAAAEAAPLLPICRNRTRTTSSGSSHEPRTGRPRHRCLSSACSISIRKMRAAGSSSANCTLRSGGSPTQPYCSPTP